MIAAARFPARSEPANNQFALQGPRANLVFQPIVVDRYVPIGQITRERLPALEAVVERLGDRRSLGDQFALGKQPLM